VRDPLFATPPAGPDASSWAAAAVRSLHPARWGLALAGLAATAVVAAVAQAVFEGRAPRLADWFGHPATQARALGEHLAARSFAGVVVRLGAVAAVVAGAWSLIGGWIARHEVLARHRGRPGATADPLEPGPTRLVAGKPKDLVLGLVVVLILGGVLLLPVLLAGGLNRLGGVGAILVAVLLPVVLLADLILLLIAAGLVVWPLMPVTIAVENSDLFDALSRAYNYAFARPARFILLMAITLAAAAVPTGAVLWLLAGPVESWPEAAGHPAVWAAAGLSASLFWSLQTLAYLNLRSAIDEVDANEIVREGGSKPAAPAPPETTPQPADATSPKPPARFGMFMHVFLFGAMVATWVVTAWLFAQFGGETAGWLGWGVGEEFRPPAEGVYWLASIVAGVWGAIWVAAPAVVAVRQVLRPGARDTQAKSPG